MGDISIIARRLGDVHVQYGWSGNGGYYSMVGARLLDWYQDPKDVEYLFSLGQTGLIGRKGSEHGGYSFFESHRLTGEAFWLGDTERLIFSKIAFIDYGYFYDVDNKWYYIIPGPFRVKIPLELIDNNLDEEANEFDYLENIQKKIIEYIFCEYTISNPDFSNYMKECGYDADKVFKEVMEERSGIYTLFDKYSRIYKYFDDWIVVKSDAEYKNMTEIIVKKSENVHVETCFW